MEWPAVAMALLPGSAAMTVVLIGSQTLTTRRISGASWRRLRVRAFSIVDILQCRLPHESLTSARAVARTSAVTVEVGHDNGSATPESSVGTARDQRRHALRDGGVHGEGQGFRLGHR